MKCGADMHACQLQCADCTCASGKCHDVCMDEGSTSFSYPAGAAELADDAELLDAAGCCGQDMDAEPDDDLGKIAGGVSAAELVRRCWPDVCCQGPSFCQGQLCLVNSRGSVHVLVAGCY